MQVVFLKKFLRLDRQARPPTLQSVLALRLAVVLAVSSLLLGAFALPAAAADRGFEPPRTQVAAQEGEGAQDEGGSSLVSRATDPVVVWSLVGLGVFAAAMGALYFFKREVGAFPENPSWVAPISIMQSSTFPDEGDFGDAAPGHGTGH